MENSDSEKLDTEKLAKLMSELKPEDLEVLQEPLIKFPSCLTYKEKQDILLNKQFCRLKIIKKHYFDGNN